MRTIAACLAFSIASVAIAQTDAPREFVHPRDAEAERQFDFWLGQWDVHNRFIAEDGSERIVEAEALIWPALDGQVVVEHWRSLSDAWPMRGFSMRAYNPATDRWTIALCWPGQGPARIGVMEGRFRNGRGEFFPPDTPEGDRPTSRFTFSDAGPNSLRWDGASPVGDDERAWRTNWIMEWSRRAADDTIDLATLHGDGASENDAMDWLVGDWRGWFGGPHPDPTPRNDIFRGKPSLSDTLEAERVLDGRAILLHLIDNDPEFDEPGVRRMTGQHVANERLALIAWDRDAEVWRICMIGTDDHFALYDGVIEGGALAATTDDGEHRILLERTSAGMTWTMQRRAEEADEWSVVRMFHGRRLDAPAGSR